MLRKVALFIASISAFIPTAGCEKKASASAKAPPPPEVSVAPVIERDVPMYGDWVATLDGFQNAQIQPQVSGYLLRQNYREGSYVHKGDVLFEIDPRPFQAVLDQARGQLAQANAQLAQARSQLQLAEINVQRDTPLAQAHAIAQSQLDTDVQTRAQQQAAVQLAQAGIEAAKASVEQAALNVGFTKVRSLLDGIAGIATTQIRNLVQQTTVLTSVSQVNPIKAYFPISESEYLQFAEAGGRRDWISSRNNTPLQLTLTDGRVYGIPGQILFADRQVDQQTGTIRIAGMFRNPGNVLRPGEFGRVKARTGLQHNALLIPQRAVTDLQGHYLVSVVGPGNKISTRVVNVGNRVGEYWIITSGVTAGERVVTEGLTKIKDGETVTPQPDKQAEKGPSING